MTMWDPEAVLPKQRPAPDTANLLTQTDIKNLAKNATLVKAAEAWLAKIREKAMPLLQRTLSRNETLELLMDYEVTAVRLMFAKK